MGTSLLNVAITGLNAAQAGLLTTSHNTANAKTEGYNRQRIIQTTQTPQYTGSGFIGQGTRVLTVERLYSSYLTNQLQSSQATTSQLEAYNNQIGLIDNLLGDTTSGMSPAIQGFFTSVNAVASAPNDTSARQSLLSAGQSVVSRFQSMSGRLDEIYQGSNSQIVSEVDAINSIAQQISALNHRISVAESAGSSQSANDLHDQRDNLVLELNKHISADVLAQSDGSFSIFFGNGQPLVVGENVFTLGATVSSSDASRVDVTLTSPNGATSQIPESLVNGGALGGLLEFRSKSLDTARNALGRMAVALAYTFNDQHQLGIDLTGATGNSFFTEPTPLVIADANNAAAATAPGTITATISDVSSLTTSDYVLSRGTTGYSLMRLSDSQIVYNGSSLPATVDGITITASGLPAVGSSFKIMPTRNAATAISVALTNTNNIAAGLPVMTAAGAKNTGTVTVGAGGVSSPITLTYSSGGGGYTGFPAGTSVALWDGTAMTTVNVTSSAQVVTIPPGGNNTATVNGITFKISAAPNDGDTFSITPSRSSPLQAGSLNTSAATIAASGHMQATFTYNGGALSLTPTPSPLLNTTVSVTSGGVTTDYPIRLGNETIPYVSGASYSYNGTTFTISGAPTNGDTFTVGSGYAGVPAATTTATFAQTGTSISSSLPSSTYTVGYDKANNLLTGFPAGTTVAVTVNGTTTQYPISSPNQGIPYTNHMSIAINGVTTTFSGTPGDGDTFTIGPSSANTTDSRNVQALALIQTQKILNGGTASIESAYSQLVSEIGNKAREIDTTYEAQTTLLKQATEAVQSFSGVNLDEEAANLLAYQQAYQASARIIDVSSKLFDLLTSLGG